MKITRKIQLAFLTVAMIFSTILSCQKQNNDTAKSLDGQWTVTQMTKGNGAVDENSMPQSVTLETCKVRKSNCNGTWVSNNGDQESFYWATSDKGNVFTIFKDASQLNNQANSDLAEYKGDYNILELSDSRLIIIKDNIKMELKK